MTPFPDTASASTPCHRSPLAKWLGVACVALVACAQPFARLDGVLVETRPALPEEFGRVQIIREGKTRNGAPRMGIEKGDTMLTAADGVAVLTLQAGWEVIIEPGAVVNIENPSIFVKIGKLIIKKLREVKEALTVNNQFVSAGVEGTVFVFEVARDNSVQIAVVEGRVVVHSRLARWEAVTYQAGDAGTIRPGTAPSRMQRLDSVSVRAIRRRVLEVEQVIRPEVPDLTGLTEPAARDALASAGLRTGSVLKVITRRAPAGIVVATSPPGGSQRRAGDRVSLHVEDSSLVVPRVLGLPFGDAVDALRRAGFAPPDTASMYAPNTRIGTVMGAAPSDGSAVSATTRVRLTLARQTPDRVIPTDTTRTGTCRVPNLIERSEETAKSMLSRANLQPGRVTRLRYGTTITRQRPEAGSSVQCRSRVDFDIGTNIGE